MVSEREVKTPRSGYPVTNYLRYETLRNRAISFAIVDCDVLFNCCSFKKIPVFSNFGQHVRQILLCWHGQWSIFWVRRLIIFSHLCKVCVINTMLEFHFYLLCLCINIICKSLLHISWATTIHDGKWIYWKVIQFVYLSV